MQHRLSLLGSLARVTAVGLAGLLLCALTASTAAIPGVDEDLTRVALPKVVGTPLPTALKTLGDLPVRLTIKTFWANGSVFDKNPYDPQFIVDKQDPKDGTDVKDGDLVSLIVPDPGPVQSESGDDDEEDEEAWRNCIRYLLGANLVLTLALLVTAILIFRKIGKP